MCCRVDVERSWRVSTVTSAGADSTLCGEPSLVGAEPSSVSAGWSPAPGVDASRDTDASRAAISVGVDAAASDEDGARPGFGAAGDSGRLPELARCLRTSIAKIEAALNHPPYNYLIHTSPLNVRSLDHYHWHFEIIPRITRVAGFEWGSGFYINTVPPEQAAAFLREVRV